MTIANVGDILEYNNGTCHFIVEVLRLNTVSTFKGKILNIFKGECSGYTPGYISTSLSFQFFEYPETKYNKPTDPYIDIINALDNLESKLI